jgi:hypothetical protein
VPAPTPLARRPRTLNCRSGSICSVLDELGVHGDTCDRATRTLAIWRITRDVGKSMLAWWKWEDSIMAGGDWLRDC